MPLAIVDWGSVTCISDAKQNDKHDLFVKKNSSVYILRHQRMTVAFQWSTCSLTILIELKNYVTNHTLVTHVHIITNQRIMNGIPVPKAAVLRHYLIIHVNMYRLSSLLGTHVFNVHTFITYKCLILCKSYVRMLARSSSDFYVQINKSRKLCFLPHVTLWK